MQQAVAVDVRAEHVAHALVEIAFEERQQLQCALFLPTIDADETFANVCAEDDVLRTELLQPGEYFLAVGDGDASEGHHVCTCVKGFLQVFLSLDAAPEVHNERCLGGDAPEHIDVDDVLGAGSVQVYDMKAPEAQHLHLLCHHNGVMGIDLLRSVVALGETNATASDDVYGWNESHVALFRYFDWLKC